MTSADVDSTARDEHVGTDRRELEWQMITTDLSRARHWLTERPATDGWVIEARPTLELRDTYFDTGDWRIFRSGFALRVRNESGTSEATLKELQSARPDAADRRELTEPIDSADDGMQHLAGPVGVRVHAVVGAEQLRALFDAHTSRQRFVVRRQGSSEDLAEIALDETVISHPKGAPQASLRRVEVEALTVECEPIEGFVSMLSRECALAPATDSKYALGLRSVGLAPPAVPDFGPSHVDGTMRVDEIAMSSLRRHWSMWLAHEPAARLGDDSEELHDLRIAGRRIDATLSLFAPFLPVTVVRMRPRLKILLRALGAVRDLDIELGELEKFEREMVEGNERVSAPLKRRLENERARARSRMLRVLDAPSTQRWQERLTRFLVQMPPSPRHRTQPQAIAVVPALVRSRYRKFRKAADRLTTTSSAEEYHGVRGRVKKLRYAIESVETMYGEPVGQFLRSLRRLQDRLGEQQDAHVAQARLNALGRESNGAFPAETIFLMGRMAERHSVSEQRARGKFEKAQRPLRRKRWKKLRRRLDELNTQPREPASQSSSQPSPGD